MKKYFFLLFFLIYSEKIISKEDLRRNFKIFVAGHNGLVGSSIISKLQKKRFVNIITRSSKELDLRNQGDVLKFFEQEKPEYVFLAAAKVGGIKANMEAPAEFIYDNLMIETNIINASFRNNVKKLLFLGSSCIYPRLAKQPMLEEYLLSGKLEPTNEGYAIAKIIGIKMCEAFNKQFKTNFISIMPPNLYGQRDNFSNDSSHVIPALIRKIYNAKQNNNSSVEIWGSGNARREFLYVDDLAEACLFFMENLEGNDFVNVGTGQDITIKELALLIKDLVGFQGDIIFDTSKPDGMPQKLLDVSRAERMGWKAQTSLRDGLTKTIEWYINSLVK